MQCGPMAAARVADGAKCLAGKKDMGQRANRKEGGSRRRIFNPKPVRHPGNAGLEERGHHWDLLGRVLLRSYLLGHRDVGGPVRVVPGPFREPNRCWRKNKTPPGASGEFWLGVRGGVVAAKSPPNRGAVISFQRLWEQRDDGLIDNRYPMGDLSGFQRDAGGPGIRSQEGHRAGARFSYTANPILRGRMPSSFRSRARWSG
jgi:hypothetical protein